MGSYRSAVAVMLQRRCIGYIVRHGSVGNGKSIEKPCDVARYIEKVAKEYGDNERKKERERCAELVNSMCTNITQYTAMEVRAVAHGLSLIFGKDVDGKWLQEIAAFVLKRAYIMPVYLLYPLVNSISKMAGTQSGLPFDQLLQACSDRVGEANSIDLATIAQTAVLLKKRLGIADLMSKVANATMTQQTLGEISPTNAVLILYAFAHTGIRNEQLSQILTQIIAEMEHDDVEPHLIPLALHALARLGTKDKQVLETIANHALKVTHDMGPENISGLVCALAKLRFKHSLLLRGMAKRTKQLMPSIDVRELSNIFWGFAKLKYDDSVFADDIIDRCLQYNQIDNMSFAQIFEAIRCYHAVHKSGEFNFMPMISNVPTEAIKELLQRYLTVMPQCSTQIVTQMAWCSCSLGRNDHGIVSKSLDVLKSRKRNRVEQKYVDMLLEALKTSKLEPEEKLRHYITELRSDS